MIRFVSAILVIIFLINPIRAEDVPFATSPRLNSTPTSESVASLADIMGKIQLRHIKLSQAIKSKNWPLVNYEVGQCRDTFVNAVLLYRNIPVDLIVAADKSLAILQQAAASKDEPKLKQGFADLTAACNSCHQAAQIGFIKIQIPNASPFSDQKF